MNPIEKTFVKIVLALCSIHVLWFLVYGIFIVTCLLVNGHLPTSDVFEPLWLREFLQSISGSGFFICLLCLFNFFISITALLGLVIKTKNKRILIGTVLFVLVNVGFIYFVASDPGSVLWCGD